MHRSVFLLSWFVVVLAGTGASGVAIDALSGKQKDRASTKSTGSPQTPKKESWQGFTPLPGLAVLLAGTGAVILYRRWRFQQYVQPKTYVPFASMTFDQASFGATSSHAVVIDPPADAKHQPPEGTPLPTQALAVPAGRERSAAD
jgi:hypothetical protein